MINLNLTSQIVLKQIPEKYYNPKTAVEASELTRCEKIPTSIHLRPEDGAKHIADAIEAEIKAKRAAGKHCVLGLGTGISLNFVFNELIRRHREEGLSFSNVIVFNAYEYFPLSEDNIHSSLRQLCDRFLDHVDIDKRNVFSPDSMAVSYTHLTLPTN